MPSTIVLGAFFGEMKHKAGKAEKGTKDFELKA